MRAAFSGSANRHSATCFMRRLPCQHREPRSSTYIRRLPLQRLRLIPRRAYSDIALLIVRQDHRHRLRMDRLDDCVRRCGQEAIDEMRSDIRASTSYPAVIFTGERKASRAVVSISIYEKRPRRSFTKFRYRGCGGRPLDTTARQAVSFVVPARPTGRTRRPATSRAG